MMKTVRKRASPTRTWVGGTCWVPRAWRRKEKVITSLVKEVIISRMAGAMESTVNRSRISMRTETCLGFWVSPRPICRVGRVTALAKSGQRMNPANRPRIMVGQDGKVLFRMDRILFLLHAGDALSRLVEQGGKRGRQGGEGFPGICGVRQAFIGGKGGEQGDPLLGESDHQISTRDLQDAHLFFGSPHLAVNDGDEAFRSGTNPDQTHFPDPEQQQEHEAYDNDERAKGFEDGKGQGN